MTLRPCFLSSFEEFCSAVSGEKSKMSQPIRGQGGHLVFLTLKFDLFLKNFNLGCYLMVVASCQVSLNSVRAVSEKSKMSQPIWGQGGNFIFPIGQKKNPTNLVKDVEILLPVKFRWISFSGFRGEVKNVSANRRPGRPFYFSDWHKKTQTW